MKRLYTVNLTFFMLVCAAIFAPLAAGSILSDLSVHQVLIITEVLYVTVALAVVALRDRLLIGEIGAERISAAMLWKIIVLGFLIQPVATWLNLFSMLFVKNYVVSGLSGMGSSVIYNLLYAALAPAVAEEFIFRGLLFHGYRGRGVRYSAVFSGLLFGLLHMNLNQFVYAFALGVVLALLVEASGSIYASMLVHFMINARSVIILSLSEKALNETLLAEAVEETTGSMMLSAFLLYTPIALLCSVGIFFLLRKIAKDAGRGEYFDLVLHASEMQVHPHLSASEAEVLEGRRMVSENCSEVLKDIPEDAAVFSEQEKAEQSPAQRAARFAPKADETMEDMSLRTKLMLYLPAILGAVMCFGYMIWIEIH